MLLQIKIKIKIIYCIVFSSDAQIRLFLEKKRKKHKTVISEFIKRKDNF